MNVLSKGECVVMKFGGTSVEDAPAIRRAIQLVNRRRRHRPVVIVSALAKVTDQLAGAGTAAAAGELDAARETVRGLRERHEAVARELVSGKALEILSSELGSGFQSLAELATVIAVQGEFTPCLQDRFLGMGEILSSKVFHAALQHAGFDSAWVDPKDCIVTDAVHTRANPLCNETNELLRDTLMPLVLAGRVPVLGGFVGATPDGAPTTLGRGGSDFTAALVGAALHAQRIEIWTDVDGVMTTDPNVCPDAKRVTSMTFHEAADLAYFGAKVLHPATLEPAMRRNIPVWVLNSRNPQSGGTEIVAQTSDGGRVKAITARRGMAVVDVDPLRRVNSRLLHEVFEVLERHGHSLELLSASRGSLSLLVNSTAALPAISRELESLASVRWENHKALICLVGEKIRRRPEIASQVFHAISDIDTRMICQGASERTIGFLVDESRAEEAIRRLHELLFSGRVRRAKGPSQAVAQVSGSYN